MSRLSKADEFSSQLSEVVFFAPTPVIAKQHREEGKYENKGVVASEKKEEEEKREEGRKEGRKKKEEERRREEEEKKRRGVNVLTKCIALLCDPHMSGDATLVCSQSLALTPSHRLQHLVPKLAGVWKSGKDVFGQKEEKEKKERKKKEEEKKRKKRKKKKN